MKIAVIGCRGQLGTDCSTLLSGRHQLICWDTPHFDIGNGEVVETSIGATRPDVIINCAAYTAVDACEHEKELCWRVNAEGPRHLAQAATRYSCRLIHISTDYVFDGALAPPAGYSEDDSTNPLSEYGRSKLAGEQAVLNYAEDQVILRTAWLYSPYGRNFVKTMLRLALQDPERPLKVVNDQFGSLTWSHPLTLQIEKLLTADIKGIVHATATGHSTWYEAACYFLERMNVRHNLVPCTTAEYPTPARRPANSILTNTRLERAGLSVFGDWRDDVDRFVRIYRQKLMQELD